MNIHRTGPCDPIFIDVALTASKPGRTIHQGALLAVDAAASPAGLVDAPTFTWDTNLATTQAAFALAFRGMCVSESILASTDARQLTVTCLQDGNVEFDLAAALGSALVEGDYIGPAKDSGNAMLNSCVKVATKSLAVAVVQKPAAIGATRVVARLVNTIPKK